MGIEGLADQRDEQRARSHLAAVGRYALEGRIRPDQARARDGVGQLLQRSAHQCVLNM
ncbi:hypothetical protein LTR94_035057, partial [Friedmanniomyces endolithicus]